MIPESEWLLCQAPGCGKPIKPHRKEGRGQYAIRCFCSRQCSGAGTFKHVELRRCANPACSNLVPRDAGMKPSDYARRKSCSPACARAVQSIRALARADRGSNSKGYHHHSQNDSVKGFAKLSPTRDVKRGPARKAKPKTRMVMMVNEADAIAAFIAQNGITYCPPKYAAVTLNAALPENEAQQIIKLMPIEERSYRTVNNAFWAAKKQSQVIGNT